MKPSPPYQGRLQLCVLHGFSYADPDTQTTADEIQPHNACHVVAIGALAQTLSLLADVPSNARPNRPLKAQCTNHGGGDNWFSSSSSPLLDERTYTNLIYVYYLLYVFKGHIPACDDGALHHPDPSSVSCVYVWLLTAPPIISTTPCAARKEYL